MKLFWRIFGFEILLILVLIMLSVLFLMSVDVINVKFFEPISSMFKPDYTGGDYKKYGVLGLFISLAFMTLYGCVHLIFNTTTIKKSFLYGMSVIAYGSGISGIVVSLLLLIVNF